MSRWRGTRWQRFCLKVQEFDLLGCTWELERPVRLALDWGLITVDEYCRRRWERDYWGLPDKCYMRI